MFANSLLAAERNEKSRHAPHVCKKSCGCGKKGKPIRGKDAKPPKPGERSLQAYNGPRSWVIEHA
jgi:hypothetical protein